MISEDIFNRDIKEFCSISNKYSHSEFWTIKTASFIKKIS